MTRILSPRLCGKRRAATDFSSGTGFALWQNARLSIALSGSND
ncbi:MULTISPECIES: hypothetical protein [Ralstonia]|nr:MULTISPECIES: hypothetical protein [Ralstonia]MDH6642334.1 hypothetical protein [Ralstonia sp. GP73]MDR9382815.1 hypothetical protein [Ralstonia sp. 11b]MEA3269136.1 hypothetical protein [Pseudomonadota bacterium]